MWSSARLSSGEYYQTRGITGHVGKHFSVVSMKVTSTKNLERKNRMNMLLANEDIHSSFDRISVCMGKVSEDFWRQLDHAKWFS